MSTILSNHLRRTCCVGSRLSGPHPARQHYLVIDRLYALRLLDEAQPAILLDERDPPERLNLRQKAINLTDLLRSKNPQRFRKTDPPRISCSNHEPPSWWRDALLRPLALTQSTPRDPQQALHWPYRSLENPMQPSRRPGLKNAFIASLAVLPWQATLSLDLCQPLVDHFNGLVRHTAGLLPKARRQRNPYLHADAE